MPLHEKERRHSSSYCHYHTLIPETCAGTLLNHGSSLAGLLVE
jgi:hypothetical protein